MKLWQEVNKENEVTKLTYDLTVAADRTKFVDEVQYHNGLGSIHCGSNVRRKVPTASNWWQ